MRLEHRLRLGLELHPIDVAPGAEAAPLARLGTLKAGARRVSSWAKFARIVRLPFHEAQCFAYEVSVLEKDFVNMVALPKEPDCDARCISASAAPPTLLQKTFVYDPAEKLFRKSLDILLRVSRLKAAP